MIFKIDFFRSSYNFPFGLYLREALWHTPFTGRFRWRLVESFASEEKARAFYEKIKHLPIYL